MHQGGTATGESIAVGDSTYKGDSPGKKATRARLWFHAAKWMQTIDQPYRGALVLAGHGGDISTLEGLCIDTSKVTAVDIAPDAAEYCAELYPNCNVVCGDAAKVSETVEYNVAHLDFCNQLNVDNIYTIRQVALNAKKPAYIGVTMLKGREQSSECKQKLMPPMSSAVRRRVRSYHIGQKDMVAAHFLHATKPFDPRKAIKSAEELLRKGFDPHHDKTVPPSHSLFTANGRRLSGLGSAMARADVVHTLLDLSTWGTDVLTRVVLVTAYQSRTSYGHGTPFFTMGLAVEEGWDNYDKRTSLLMDANSSLLFMRSLLGGYEKDCLKLMAVELANLYSASEVAKILDVKTAQVAAWKAHNTMGTYNNKDVDAKVDLSLVETTAFMVHNIAVSKGWDTTLPLPIARGDIPSVEEKCDNLGWAKDQEVELVIDQPNPDAGWGKIISICGNIRKRQTQEG